MGFNISGIVINKNLKEQKEELSEILNLNLEFDKEIDFQTASENWKDGGIIDVYFGENGTLIFANEDVCLGDGYSYPDTNILTFAMSETSMVFNFGYTENQNNIRSKMEVNGEIIYEQGSKLKIENDNKDISEIIWKQIEIVLGKKFWDIQPEEKSIRYYINNSEETEPEPLSTITEQEIIENIIEEKIQPPKTQNSKKNTPENKSGIYTLIGIIAFGLLLVIGLIYAIYNIFTLP